MKRAFQIFIMKLIQSDSEIGAVISYLIGAAIECIVLSLIISGIATLVFDKDFEEWFTGSIIVVGIIEVMIFLAILFS